MSHGQEGLIRTVTFGQVPQGREGAKRASVWEKTRARSPASLVSAWEGAAGCWEISQRGSQGLAHVGPDWLCV